MSPEASATTEWGPALTLSDTDIGGPAPAGAASFAASQRHLHRLRRRRRHRRRRATASISPTIPPAATRHFAQVQSVQCTDPLAAAGVMFRNSTGTAGDMMVFLGVTAADGLVFETRTRSRGGRPACSALARRCRAGLARPHSQRHQLYRILLRGRQPRRLLLGIIQLGATRPGCHGADGQLRCGAGGLSAFQFRLGVEHEHVFRRGSAACRTRRQPVAITPPATAVSTARRLPRRQACRQKRPTR